MIHQELTRKRKRFSPPCFFFFVFKGSKNDSSGTLKEAFRLPGGNVIPTRRSRVTQGGMRGIKGGLEVEEARQSP